MGRFLVHRHQRVFGCRHPQNSFGALLVKNDISANITPKGKKKVEKKTNICSKVIAHWGQTNSVVRVAARSTYKRASGLAILKFSVFHTHFKAYFFLAVLHLLNAVAKRKSVFLWKKKEAAAMAQFAGINNLWSKLTDEQENRNVLENTGSQM